MDNVAFCFIVKDGYEYLERNLLKIIKFANLYIKNYKIYYVENDSIDKTNEVLNRFKKKYNNIYGKHLQLDGKHSTDLCENIIDPNCSNRTRRLAYLRNIALEQAKKWKKCNYLFMLDLDFIDFDITKLYKMFNIIKNNEYINGIFGMSYTPKNYLYDVGAIRPLHKIINIFLKQDLVKVSSAFSGFGIYKMKYIIDNNIRYNEKTNSIEHIDFNNNFTNLYVYSNFNPIYSGHEVVRTYCIIIFILLFIVIIILVYILHH
jgi:hypothetical protein